MTEELPFKDLEERLKTTWLGRKMTFVPTYSSTNALAFDLGIYQQLARDGEIYLAGEQTRGRGRFDRVWHSPKDLNLYLSMFLRPRVPQHRVAELSMLAAISLRTALRQVVQRTPRSLFGLKWPNDVVVGGRKLSGILCEARTDLQSRLAVVVGVGVNVNAGPEDFPPELQETATSLRIVTGRRFPLSRVLATYLNIFEKLYEKWNRSLSFKSYASIWSRHDVLLGQHVEVRKQNASLAGTVLGLSPRGELRLRLDGDGSIFDVNSGDILIRKD